MSILKIDNLSVSYGGIKAVKNITLVIEEGQIVTLIGANGAGKSTILKAISQIIRYQGKILFCNQDLSKMATLNIARLIAHCPEGRQVLAQQSVIDNLEIGAYCRSGPIKHDIEKMFTFFPRLYERKHQLAGTLSGDEQQMLAIARALMAKPRVLLLDEPSLGLAPIIVREIMEIIKNLRKDGMTILLVEQNAKLALQMADQAYVLEAGQITISGEAGSLLENPRVKQAYLG